jgi:hypothetical protein
MLSRVVNVNPTHMTLSDWLSRILLAQLTELAFACECVNCGWSLLKHQICCPQRGRQRPILINGIEIDMEPRSRLHIGGTEYSRRKNRQRSARHQKPIYTPGDLKNLVDAFLHPLAKTSPDLFILDGILHGIIEENPPETVLKFILHNLPKLLSQLMRSWRTN